MRSRATRRLSSLARRAGPLTAALLVALIAGLAAAGVVGAAPSDADRKADVDRELARVQEQLRAAQGRESVLTDQVSAYSAKIRLLEEELVPLRRRAASLQAELDALRVRLDALTTRLDIERRRLARAEDLLNARQRLLADRLRDVYSRGEPDPLLTMIETGSLSAAVDTADVLEQIVAQDNRLVQSVTEYTAQVRDTKEKIAGVRAEVAEAERRAAAATQAALEAKEQLERERAVQQKLRAGRSRLLERVEGNRRHIEEEAQDLAARSAALGERIRAAQGVVAGPSGYVAPGTVSASGFAWPVSGPITSGYGMRWGRMHEGIDISGGSGTPIAAAAGGTVILAGPQGGYGNLVVVDHGGGVSTAYAHLSSFAVGVGQTVGQGTVIGGMGTTGNSTGNHLHFEVRVNGAAVDPLGYL
jgi:murein DD-endopeptidase MepM/ murein hydrolase activator NlpD